MFGLTLIAILAVGVVAAWAEKDERRLKGLAAGFVVSVFAMLVWGLVTESLFHTMPDEMAELGTDEVHILP